MRLPWDKDPLKRVKRYDRAIKQLRAKRSRDVRVAQSMCEHPLQAILESPRVLGVPAARVCTRCGLCEESERYSWRKVAPGRHRGVKVATRSVVMSKRVLP